MPPIRARRGVRPDLQTFERPAVGHPSETRQPYSNDIRQFAIQNYANGNDATPGFAQLRAQGAYPSRRSVQRWARRVHQFGHTRPFIHTGNNCAEREINGMDLFYVSLYRVAFPRATAAEINAFLYNMNQHYLNFRFYSASQISRCEKSIHLTTKRSSTTAYRALLPVNVMRRDQYFNLPYPFGIADMNAEDMIDVDEAAIELTGINPNRGKSVEGQRVRDQGPYSKVEKVNLMLAICGDLLLPERWTDMWDQGGTTVDRLLNFLRRVIDDLAQVAPNRSFCFTMDNLSTHRSPLISNLIFAHGHRLVFRAPYYPIDGAIEYVFNTVQSMLRLKLNEILTREDLVEQIRLEIANIPIFTPYFRHVGFIN